MELIFDVELIILMSYIWVMLIGFVQFGVIVVMVIWVFNVF